jgi:hypothetical protein
MNKFILTVSVGISVLSQSYAADEIGGPGALKYLDNLKTCTPFTFSYPHPFVHGFTGQNIIKGKEAGNCLVTFVMPHDKKLECRFTPETIKLLTSEAAYEEARQQSFAFADSAPASKRMAEECKL